MRKFWHQSTTPGLITSAILKFCPGLIWVNSKYLQWFSLYLVSHNTLKLSELLTWPPLNHMKDFCLKVRWQWKTLKKRNLSLANRALTSTKQTKTQAMVKIRINLPLMMTISMRFWLKFLLKKKSANNVKELKQIATLKAKQEEKKWKKRKKRRIPQRRANFDYREISNYKKLEKVNFYDW